MPHSYDIILLLIFAPTYSLLAYLCAHSSLSPCSAPSARSPPFTSCAPFDLYAQSASPASSAPPVISTSSTPSVSPALLHIRPKLKAPDGPLLLMHIWLPILRRSSCFFWFFCFLSSFRFFCLTCFLNSGCLRF